ncbi:MAG: glycosyltransferase family 39 protein [Hyphomicrobiaceae bacterium]
MTRHVATHRAAAATDTVPLLVAILAALLIARLALLYFNRTELFFDEAQYWSWAQNPAAGYYSKPPLIAWLIAGTTWVCGTGEACIRLSSPVLHIATAGIVYLIGEHLYDRRVGFWSALVYATLPAVSLSSGIVSTDVPLLLFWALALLFFLRLTDGGSLANAFMLGLALGLGLLAKYAMAFFVPLAALALLADRDRARRMGVLSPLIALAVAALVASPNLLWNLENGFATFSHTADNAKWTGSLVHPLKLLEFIGAQFGVFGPILFAALLVLSWRLVRHDGQGRGDERTLLAFSLPVLVVIAIQAFVSRAHANWAAVAYVSATVLVTAEMFRGADRRWFATSFAINAALALLIGVLVLTAGRGMLPAGAEPFSRMLGWRETADETRRRVDNADYDRDPFGTILVDDRGTLAELLYYYADSPLTIAAWREGEVAKDHYELTRPFTSALREPVLLVSPTAEITGIAERFDRVDQLGSALVGTGPFANRTMHFFRLEGYRGR